MSSRRQHRGDRARPFPQPETLLSGARQCSIVLSPTMWCYVIHCLHLLFLCWLTFSGYMIFKIIPKTDLMTIGRREAYIFMDISRKPVDGLGVEFLGDGTCYAGEFKNGVRTGSGVSELAEIRSYGGDWVEGLAEGYGVEILGCMESAGLIYWRALYMGQFVRGTRDGYGSMESDGNTYMGKWHNGRKNGIGRQEGVDWNYEGEFFRDMMHGFGSYHKSNGDIYRGMHSENEIKGFGIYQFSSGERYEGSWHGNKMEGYGVYIQEENSVPISGKWANGEIREEDYIPLSDPRIKEAVQAAQEASQNCRQLGEIEDQVIEAVIEADNACMSAKLASFKAH